MGDESRIDTHQPAARGIGGDGVVSKNEAPEVPHGTMQWTIAFHCLNPIRNHEMYGYGRGELDDGIVDSFPMQYVLRPAVDGVPTVVGS